MGKGEIVSGGTDGLYSALSIFRKDLLEKQTERLDDQIAFYETAVSEATDPQEKNMLTAQLTAVEQRKNFLIEGMPDDLDIQVWCADLTEDLSGEIGLIEIPGEKTNFNIQPGYFGTAGFNAARDGQLVPTITMTPDQAFYNFSVLPGWQKWKPTFRYGTITSLSGGLADVDVEDIRSTQQNLKINQSDTLSGVPIEYMDCDGIAFEVGDGVLIMFTGQDWAQPKIIGFKDNPQPCIRKELILVRAAIDRPWNDPEPLVWYVTIFDLETSAAATDIPTNGGPDAVFPCLFSEISDWVAASTDTGTPLFWDPWFLAQGRPNLQFPTCVINGSDNTVVAGGVGADGTTPLYNNCTYNFTQFNNPDFNGVSTLDQEQTKTYESSSAFIYEDVQNEHKVGTNLELNWTSIEHREGTQGITAKVSYTIDVSGNMTYGCNFGAAYLDFSASMAFVYNEDPQFSGEFVEPLQGPCLAIDGVKHRVGNQSTDLYGSYGSNAVYQIFAQALRAVYTDADTGDVTCEDNTILIGTTKQYADPLDVASYDPRAENTEDTDFSAVLVALNELSIANNDTIDFGTQLRSSIQVRPGG